jgi:enamine deaminase RidA (YjgF/YER057c/UK114 family)
MFLYRAIGREHGERFAHIRPASTLVAVSALISPELLVEIEVTAVVE